MRAMTWVLIGLALAGCKADPGEIGDGTRDESDELARLDSDRDGLSDGDEAVLGTDPRNPDTDGGGRLDGGEVVAGLDPTDVSDDMCYDAATGATCWVDGDYDSLHDDDERLIGTDPNAYDTDGGGISDWMEVYFVLDPTDASDDGVDLYADTDTDGLSDVLEANRYGTDAALADSDGGGLGDGEEVFTYGTDPLDAADDAWPVADDDGDGLQNYQEGWYGTDPALADSDGGGVNDYDELYVDGTDPLYGADDGTDPYLDTDGDWLTDNYELRYGTDPLLADTDGGGLSDGEEVYSWMTDPLDAADDAAIVLDTDGDGLRDVEESWYGTDPTLADTDGGGVDDYTELYVDGTNALDGADDGLGRVDTDGDGLTDLEESWYGTDPTLADTDGGGASDYDELYVDWTNPLDGADDIAR